MNKDEYKAYLKSEAWSIRRQFCMDRFGERCALCNEKAMHVHHRTYERVGNEHANDLTALCGSCHEKFHGKGEYEEVEIDLLLEYQRERELSRKLRRISPKLGEFAEAFNAKLPLFSRPPRPHNTDPVIPEEDNEAR